MWEGGRQGARTKLLLRWVSGSVHAGHLGWSKCHEGRKLTHGRQSPSVHICPARVLSGTIQTRALATLVSRHDHTIDKPWGKGLPGDVWGAAPSCHCCPTSSTLRALVKGRDLQRTDGTGGESRRCCYKMVRSLMTVKATFCEDLSDGCKGIGFICEVCSQTTVRKEL